MTGRLAGGSWLPLISNCSLSHDMITADSSAANVVIDASRRKGYVAVVCVTYTMSKFEFVGKAYVVVVASVVCVVLVSVAGI